MSGRSTLTAWERWELASFDESGGAAGAGGATVAPGTAQAADAVPPSLTFSAEEIARLREDARREGYADGRREGLASGHAEGMAAGRKEADAEGSRLAEAFLALNAGFEARLAELDEAVADELSALAIEIARRVVREEIAVDPRHIATVVRDALAKLPLQHAAIHLHPEDASLLRLHAGEQLTHAGHRIHEDPKLSRGDVVIESGGSHLDASVASRWRRVIEALGHDAPWVEEKRR